MMVLEKLLTIAIDPRTPKAEACNALVRLRARAKQRNIDVWTALQHMRPMPRAMEPLMLFGQYRGRRVSDVATCDPNYLLWCAREAKRSEMENSTFMQALRVAGVKDIG